LASPSREREGGREKERERGRLNKAERKELLEK
jgi:hypothetical protein